MAMLSLGALLLALMPAARAHRDTVPLYTDLGSHHRTITTANPNAQRYFDQGLRLVFGFNHGEAIRAFTEAARLDPTCAMCYWGIAYAYGPHVNAGMDSASGVAAYAAAQKAQSLSRRASATERAYIAAIGRRYARIPPANRAGLDSAYATAMCGVSGRFADDLDAAALCAEAMMDLRPWNYWKQPSGEPYPGTTEIVSKLEGVIQRNPNHPGACHYYIHAVEAVQPQKAVPCAERLAALMPGVGHMVHMPAHIYIRVGRYNDAVASNVHAVHTDEVYIEGQKPQGVYPIGYYPHNVHFLSFAATMAGRSAEAVNAARALGTKVNLDVARVVPMVQSFVPFLDLTLVTFGRWDDVLAQPLPPSDLKYASTMAHYARGVAFAAIGKPADAATELEAVKQAAAAASPDDKPVADIAMHALMGEIAQRGGRLDEAAAHFKAAMAIEDGMLYFEPPPWYYPIRHSLGAVLLRAGKAADAEALYREDLKRFPENGWALFGLMQALRAQGKTDEASAVDVRFRKAWKDADVTLTASRF
ncbi:MAG: tetratricopeptide repeat protein [Gemmatimonadales bacterium]